MSERLTNNLSTEIDYKAEVLRITDGKAKLEVTQSGYFSHSHTEYRVRMDEIGERSKYPSNIYSLSEISAWQEAYKALQ